MKVIIAGSRIIDVYQLVELAIEMAIEEGISPIEEVVSGCAAGVDKLGESWARKHAVKTTRFPANWDFHGKKAGVLRNVQMASYADALIAVWDGSSKGTAHMIKEAMRQGLKVKVFTISRDPVTRRAVVIHSANQIALRGAQEPCEDGGTIPIREINKHTEPQLCALTGTGAAPEPSGTSES
jgi:YspA, cpYpsA-related SLOG family